MAIPLLESVKLIERQYHTGEEPVLVMCSDMNAYICKYMHSTSSAYKLACELIGSCMASAWQLGTPDVAFVRIKTSHWGGLNVHHNVSAPSLGSKWMDGVVDITSSTYSDVKATLRVLYQLLKIALFDFWLANEDRNANNANLLYDVMTDRLIAIDFGCILNTATFNYPLSQLTATDTILYSDLFQYLTSGKSQSVIVGFVRDLQADYRECLKRSRKQVRQILEELPKEWNISANNVESKLQQLFVEKWTDSVWENFVEQLFDNLRNESSEV